MKCTLSIARVWSVWSTAAVTLPTDADAVEWLQSPHLISDVWRDKGSEEVNSGGVSWWPNFAQSRVLIICLWSHRTRLFLGRKITNTVDHSERVAPCNIITPWRTCHLNVAHSARRCRLVEQFGVVHHLLNDRISDSRDKRHVAVLVTLLWQVSPEGAVGGAETWTVFTPIMTI